MLHNEITVSDGSPEGGKTGIDVSFDSGMLSTCKTLHAFHSDSVPALLQDSCPDLTNEKKGILKR